jgi:hypothetical protein
MWIGALIVVLLAAVGAGVAVLLRGLDGDLPPVTWRLGSVSADARTLEVVYMWAGCSSRVDRLEVEERQRSVSITVPRHRVELPDDVVCPAILALSRTHVRLRQALAGRRLLQPRGESHDPAGLASTTRLRNGDCAAFRRLKPDAPARDVPWVARRAQTCSQLLPRSLAALPMLRRPGSRADRLPDRIAGEVNFRKPILRLDLARGARRPARVWFLPGSASSCLYAQFRRFDIRERACEASTVLARRGMYVARSCVVASRRGPRRTLAGVVPAGISRVRLLRHGRTVAHATVDRGLWSTTAPAPDRITYANTSLRVRRSSARC